MSILLDALKKSEQQRQLGKAPNIHTPAADGGTRHDGGPHWIPLGLMAAAALAMGWVGWQQLRPPPAGAAASPPEALALEAPAEAVEEPAVEGPDAEPQSSGEASADPAPVAVRRPQMVARQAPRTPVESFEADTRNLQDVKVMPPADFQETERRQAAVNRSVKEFQPASGTARPEPAADPAEPVAEPEAQVAEPLAQGAERSASQALPHVPEPITFWELPQAVRDTLPDMHITVLVFAERPEDRFVLIGGQRVVENEIYQPGVVLEQIRRDGAVFRYRTYRFLVEG